ncbi:MAG: hypothetical protein EOP34_08015 [Rickettsiales bacterium]|nr:MAG: hypothetical protein EOP34_08015 [Rickettsiales bacterium]
MPNLYINVCLQQHFIEKLSNAAKEKRLTTYASNLLNQFQTDVKLEKNIIKYSKGRKFHVTFSNVGPNVEIERLINGLNKAKLCIENIDMWIKRSIEDETHRWLVLKVGGSVTHVLNRNNQKDYHIIQNLNPNFEENGSKSMGNFTNLHISTLRPNFDNSSKTYLNDKIADETSQLKEMFSNIIRTTEKEDRIVTFKMETLD